MLATTAKKLLSNSIQSKKSKEGGNPLSGASKWLQYWWWWKSRATSFCSASVISTSQGVWDMAGNRVRPSQLARWEGSWWRCLRESTSSLHDILWDLTPHLEISEKSKRKMKRGADPSRMDYMKLVSVLSSSHQEDCRALSKTCHARWLSFIPCLADWRIIVDTACMTSWFLEDVGQFFQDTFNTWI